MIKRVFLFVLTNILVMLTIGVVLQLIFAFTGAGQWAQYHGLPLGQLMVMSLVWGFSGAIVSLMMSRALAKWFQGVQVIDPGRPGGEAEAWLLSTVYRLAKQAGISSMPEVGVYPGLEINAFATGPTKNMALVAVSAGLLKHMDKSELEGVLSHEVSHVANGDMVTMTLLQGVVNSFVIFFSWVAAIVISNALRRNDRDGEGFGDYMLRSLIHNVLQVLFSLAAFVLVLAPFSRWREYRADAAGAKLVGRRRMMAALEALKDTFRVRDPHSDPALAAFKISGGALSLFSTHPPLEDRIARLRQDASLPA